VVSEFNIKDDTYSHLVGWGYDECGYCRESKRHTKGWLELCAAKRNPQIKGSMAEDASDIGKTKKKKKKGSQSH
jgi:hypothetical protein